MRNGIFLVRDSESTRHVASEVSEVWRVLTPDSQSLSSHFTVEKLMSALPTPEAWESHWLILHVGPKMKSWLCEFLSSCLRNLKTTKIWRRALVVTIPKPNKLAGEPNKPAGDPKCYRPISLLCTPFKISEHLIYARVGSTNDPLLPREQAGFRHGRSTIDQVTLLTQDI